jgi:biotin synthase
LQLQEIYKRSLNEEHLSKEEILYLVDSHSWEELAYYSNKIREHYFGNKIDMCTIINAKSGCCDMDCSFCSQNSHSKTQIQKYSLVPKEDILSALQYTKKSSASRCGIVTSGGRLTEKDIRKVGEYVKSIDPKNSIGICASFGRLETKDLEYLKSCGITRIHHNLETSQSFYPRICSTQTWISRVETIKEALAEGFEVCSGGLFGLGESWEDRIDLSFKLSNLGIKSIPLNFFIPQKGTKLESQPLLDYQEVLKIISIFRFIHPSATIKVCGGRNIVLKDHQYDIFKAGANSMMSGNYLTSKGVDPQRDVKVLKEMGFEVGNNE